MNDSPGRRWAAALVLPAAMTLWLDWPAWRFATSGSFDAESFRLLVSHALVPATLAGLALLLCLAAGRGILRPLGADSDDSISLGVGLGTAGVLTLAAGLAGLYNARGAALILAVLLAAAFRARRSRPAHPAAPSHDGWECCLTGLCAYAAWHAFVLGAAPITDWDTLAYHLALPKLYLEKGAVIELPWLLHSHWPHAAELLYGAALALGRDSAAALFHAGLCFAWAATAAAAARRWADADAWIVGVVLLAQPALLTSAGTPHSDGAWALLHLCAAAALWRWRAEKKTGWLWAAGLCAGAAASCKLLGALALPVWALWAWRHGRTGGAARFSAAALLVCGPWYLKSWAFTDNPVWPFVPSLLGGKFGGPQLVGPLTEANTWTSWPGAEAALRYGTQWLLLPAAAAAGLAIARRDRWPGWLALLWLPAVVMVPALWRHHEGWRFMLPLYPALATTLAWQASRLRRGLWLSRAVAVALVGFAVAPLFMTGQTNPLFAVLGVRPKTRPEADRRELYLERALFGGAGLRAAGPAVGAGRVLLFREIRGYAVDADYLWGDPVIQRLLDYDSLADAAALRARLAELGVTHVLVNEGLAMYAPGAGVYTPRVNALMQQALAAGRLVRRDGPVVLYAL